MSFEDQPTREDADGGELPGELLALGRRLSGEAEALGRRNPAAAERRRSLAMERALAGWPAGADGVATGAADDDKRGWRRLSAGAREERSGLKRARVAWLTAAVAVAACLFVAVVAWRGGGEPDDVVVQRATEQTSAVAAQGNSASAAQRSDDDAAAVRSRAQATVVDSRHNLLEGLSGAEREAVLDLLEDDTGRAISFSL